MVKMPNQIKGTILSIVVNDFEILYLVIKIYTLKLLNPLGIKQKKETTSLWMLILKCLTDLQGNLSMNSVSKMEK